MRKGRWKKLLLVLLPLLVLALFALLDPHVNDLPAVLKQIDPYWFIASLGSILLYYYFDILMYQLACLYLGTPQPFGRSLRTTMIGFFYSALTPFSSGGQPMQVLQMRKYGMSVGAATCVLVLKFLAWQLTITLFGLAGMIFVPELLFGRPIPILVLYFIGFLIFLSTIALAGLAFFKPDFVFRMGEAILRFLEKRRIIRKPDRAASLHASWARTLADFREAVQFAFLHRLGMLCIFLVATAEAFCYMAVTYFIYRGLGFDTYGIWHIVLLQALLYICVSFIPLPGASIASEGGFYMVFSELFTPALRFPAVLIWRLTTYYSAIFLGMFAVLVEGFTKRKPPLDAGNDVE